MSLPIEWIEKIFAKLTMTYGHQFLDRWKGLDLAPVKADWAQELAGFAENPDAIAYALKHIPADRPPTVLQFKDLCRKAPQKMVATLTYTPSRVNYDAAQIGQMAADAFDGNRPDPKGWARKLKEREDKGERLNQVQRDSWREALGMKSYKSPGKETETQNVVVLQ